MTTPAGSGVTNKGTTYSDGSQVTSTNLNDIVDDAVFNTNAVDGLTLGLNADSPKALFVNNQGIDTAQLKDNAVTTVKITDANVTKAKIENVANLKVLGNTSGSASAPQEVTINDTDNMSDASDTTIATSESIKAYVDTTAAPTVGFLPTSYTGGESVTLPNGLIMKMGISASVGTNSSLTVEFGTDFNAVPITVQLTKYRGLKVDGEGELTVDNVTASEFTIRNGLDTAGQVYWFAIGR
jgi:hypothetical protein